MIVPLFRHAGILWAAEYSGIGSDLNDVGFDRVWHREQEPTVNGEPQPDRIRVVPASEMPGQGQPWRPRPALGCLRFEVRAFADGEGDVTTTGSGDERSRVEVLDRQVTGEAQSTTPAEEWPDPPGATRWYGFHLFLEEPWETDEDKWLVLWQLPGYGLAGQSPALHLNIDGDSWYLGGQGGTQFLQDITPGEWAKFEIGVKLSPDPEVGWVECWINNVRRRAQTFRSTMNLATDGETILPLYLKHGIYRSTAWDSTHVAYFGPLRIGSTRADVM